MRVYVDPVRINQKVREFLDEFETKIGEISQVIYLKIDVKGRVRTLYSVQYRGSGHLFEDPDVKKLLDKGGYVVGIEFIGRYKGRVEFRFRIGYSDKLSYVRVSRGRNDIELTKQALHDLRSLYLDVFS